MTAWRRWPTGAALVDNAVARLIKQAAADAGLDAARCSGHSLHAGLASAAGQAGAGLAEMTRQTRHRSTEVALSDLRPAGLWRNNVTERVFYQPGARRRPRCTAGRLAGGQRGPKHAARPVDGTEMCNSRSRLVSEPNETRGPVPWREMYATAH